MHTLTRFRRTAGLLLSFLASVCLVLPAMADASDFYKGERRRLSADGISWRTIETSITAAAGGAYIANNDTADGAITITIPAAPPIGTSILIRRQSSGAVYIEPGAALINGNTVILGAVMRGAELRFRYVDASQGWATDSEGIGLLLAGGLEFAVIGDLGVTKDGSNLVATWADQSGNGRDLTQATPASKPTWTSSGINGHAAMLHDGNSDRMSTPDIAAWDLASSSTYAVITPTSLNGMHILNHGWIWGIGLVTQRKLDWSDTANRTDTGLGIQLGKPSLVECHRQSSAPTGVRHVLNFKGTADLTYGTNGISSQALFVGANAAGSSAFSGMIGAVLIYSNEHSYEQQRMTQRFLNAVFDLQM